MAIINLENYNAKLKNIYLLMGRGVTSNIYLISGGRITIVDSGNGAEENRILPNLREIYSKTPSVSRTILTHSHFDHIGGLPELIEEFSTEIVIHGEEAAFLREVDGERIKEIEDGGEVVAGDYTFKVLHTPGHSPGSICLYEGKNRFLFSGDTVFPNGFFGRCDLPLGNRKAMIQSLKRLKEMDIDIMLPGHGMPVFSKADRQIELSFRRARKHL